MCTHNKGRVGRVDDTRGIYIIHRRLSTVHCLPSIKVGFTIYVLLLLRAHRALSATSRRHGVPRPLRGVADAVGCDINVTVYAVGCDRNVTVSAGGCDRNVTVSTAWCDMNVTVSSGGCNINVTVLRTLSCR
jgi:hypothetical protein